MDCVAGATKKNARGGGEWVGGKKARLLADEAGSSLIEMAGGLCEFVDSPWRVIFALPLKSVQCLGKPVLIERDVSYCFVSVAMEKLSLPPGVISRVTALEGMSGTIGLPALRLAVVYVGDWKPQLSMLHVLHGRPWSQLKGAQFYTQPPLLLCCSHVKRAIASCGSQGLS